MPDLKVLIVLLPLWTPLMAHSATDRCNLLTQAEVLTLLPDAAKPRLPEWAAEAPPSWGLCEWSGNGALNLTVGPGKDSRLLRAFNEKGVVKIDGLGDRAVIEIMGGMIVRGSRITVLAGDKIITLSLLGVDAETAKRTRPALEKLVRKIIDRL